MRIISRIYRAFVYMSRSISRMTLDRMLNHYFKALPRARVLEIGANKYSLYSKKIRAASYRTMDIQRENEPTICADIHEIPMRDQSVDVVIATEVLEHCRIPQNAIDEIYRVLSKEGVCILSTRFIYKIHGSPNDYYRFTDQALVYLFRDFKIKEIRAHGNKLGAIWDLFYQNDWPWRILFLINFPLGFLLSRRSKSCPCGYVVYAKKQ